MLKLLPNIRLIDENNKTCNFHEIVEGRTIVLNMFYSRCTVKCIPLGKLLKKVNLLLHDYISDNDIQFISISLDANNDKVEDINKFKSKVYDERCLNWHFYTGDYKSIEKLRYKLGMYSPEKEIDDIKSNHTGGFLIFNTKTGFTKHTEAFDNPIDISRKVIQLLTRNFYSHSYDLENLKYNWLTEEEMFDNIKSMNSMFTVPFLSKEIRDKYDNYAEKQRGFNYEPPINNSAKRMCCCKKIKR